jgi:hypothetical protein
MPFKQEFPGPDDTAERNGEKSGDPSSIHGSAIPMKWTLGKCAASAKSAVIDC